MSDELFSLSSIDGRYARETEPLRQYFSEFAYVRERIRVEIGYFIWLSSDAQLLRLLTPHETDFLNSLADSFSLEDAALVKDFERITRHDVKAIESFLRARFLQTSLADTISWLHLALTSEDTNNIAQARALRASRDDVLLPALTNILDDLGTLIRAHKSTPMLGRTHGQPAVATTLGKELAVFYSRLQKQIKNLAAHKFEAKLTGAVGNFNAAVSAAPQVDWSELSKRFIEHLGLEPNMVTTQILPYDNWIEYFHCLHHINSILLGLTQDMWRYISDDYLKLRVINEEVGSSTMPQKVNPIDFENAEGNLGIANSLFEEYARKLPVSRLQRDLSDSTVRRTFGTALGHSLVAYISIARGLERVEGNEAVMRSDLEAHWEVIAEGAQTILRAAGISEAYDLLKSLTRGKEVTETSYKKWVEELSVDESVRSKLRSLSPGSYLGLAEQIAEETLHSR